MGKDSKLVFECQRLAVFSLKSNVLENWLGDISFVPCALSCGCNPEPPVSMGVIMEGNKNVKRYMEAQSWALPLSSRAAQGLCCAASVPRSLKLQPTSDLDVMLLVYASCTTPCCSAGEGKHSAISFFVYLKIITRKNIWRNVIVSFQKSPGKESWTVEACFHTRHKADFRPVPITFWKKARSCQIFISSYIPVVWVEETKNFGGGGYFRDSWENESTTSIPTERANF